MKDILGPFCDRTGIGGVCFTLDTGSSDISLCNVKEADVLEVFREGDEEGEYCHGGTVSGKKSLMNDWSDGQSNVFSEDKVEV